jgi:hypothetical protein
MNFNRCACLALCGALLGVNGYGYGLVSEWGPYSVEAGHYVVYYYPNSPPDIVILQPSTSGSYWFECYEGDEPAAIRSITAAAGIGTVQVKVTGYDTHTYGASDVFKIQISQVTGNGIMEELTISGNYGDPGNGDTLYADLATTLSIDGNLVNPVGDVSQPVGVTSATTFSVTGDILAPVTLSGNLGTFQAGSILPGAPVTITGGVNTLQCCTSGGTSPGSVEANVLVTGHVKRLVAQGVISSRITIGSGLGSCTETCNSNVSTLDGTLEIFGDLSGGFKVSDLAGCLYVEDDLCPHWNGVEMFTVNGTVRVGGDTGNSLSTVLVEDLRAQGVIDIGGSVTGPLTFGFMGGLMTVHGGPLHDGGVLADIEIDYDITGRIVVDGGLEALIFTEWGLLHYPGLPPEGGGQIVVQGAVTPGSTIRVDGAVDGGRIEVGSLAGEIRVTGDLAGFVRVGNQEIDEAPMSGSVNVYGGMLGSIFLDRGFESGATVQISGVMSEGALFVVNADGADPGCDTWDGGELTINGLTYTEPDQVHLWEITCMPKGDANDDGLVNTFDINPFILMLTSPDTWCAAHPLLCAGSADPPGGAYLYIADLNCDGVANTFDIDPFVLKLTNPSAYSSEFPSCTGGQYMTGECCVVCGLLDSTAPEGASDEGVSGAADPGAVAGLIVENVSPELRPALLGMATQLSAELPDPDRAALWAEIASELTGE